MLDVHVISYRAKPQWLRECVASVMEAISQAPFPVSLYIIPGEKGHIGRGRARGYAAGNAPYVTCVDDDDWVEGDAFSSLSEALYGGPKAIYTKAWGWQNGKRVNIDQRQHLRVFRRDCLADFDFEAWPACDSSALMAHVDAVEGNTVYFDERLYHHRINPMSHARQILHADSDLQKRVHALGNVHKWQEFAV